MATLNDTPSSNRLHIGVFGKTNSGKSSFINALTGQEVSIVADVKGTTTDPVYKAMEINPLGACTIIDTAGFDDTTSLSEARIEKTRLAADKTDIAIIVISAEEITAELSEEAFDKEREWIEYFNTHNTPYLIAINKADLVEKEFVALIDRIIALKLSKLRENVIVISAKAGLGMDQIRPALVRLLPESYGDDTITGNLVSRGDLVVLVMPQDIQAPKGRLILPQVQTLRELLDKHCHVLSVTTDEFESALTILNKPPKLIITDSQVFDFVNKHKPEESMLTSFSVLLAALKGDIDYFLDGAKAIDSLTKESRILIAECCTHAPLSEDIGRVKLPRLLRKKIGEELTIDMVSGTDFPNDLEKYDLVIQCGACMFNKKYVMSRVEQVKRAGVAMTNYGVTIAHLTGVLPAVVIPR